MFTIQNHVFIEPYVPSEGEEFLKDFFESEYIEYNSQVEIRNLADDICSYRVADFYLPEYKVIVEFFGMYNTNEVKKKEYNQKKSIYINNSVPCLYFYPENLGIIHYSFRKRLRAELKRHGLKKELFRYNFNLLIDDKGESMMGFVLCFILLILFQFDRTAELYWQSCAVLGGLLIFLGFRIIKGYLKIFKKEYSYVNFKRE